MPPAAAPVSGGARAAGYKPRPTPTTPDAFPDAGPEFSAPTATDVKAMKGRARRRDAAEREHYERDEPPQTSPSAGRGGSQKGGAGTKGPGKLTVGGKTARPTNILRGQRVVAGGGPVEEGAGVLLGLFLYALALNFIKYGPDGLRGWLRAKFFNEAYKPPGAPVPKPSPFAPSSPAPAAPKPASTPAYPATGVLV